CLGLQSSQDAVGLDPPVGAAREFFRTFRAEHALVGEIGNPGLPLGGALRRPWRQSDFAHSFGDLAYLFAAPTAVLDDTLEEIGALLFPVDAGKSFRRGGQPPLLPPKGRAGGKTSRPPPPGPL